MSKVKKLIVEAAIIKLIDNISKTMPNSTYKFLLGSASALATFNNGKYIDNLLTQVADNEGYIDVEQIRCMSDSGFKASDGKIQIDLFNNKSGLLNMFIKPITLTITKSDIDELIDEMNLHAIQNVLLSAS